VTLHLLFETLGIVTVCAAIGVRWSSSRYSESAPAPVWAAYDPPSWDLSGQISTDARRARTKLTVRALNTIALLLGVGAPALGIAATHSDNQVVLAIATTIAGCCLVGGVGLLSIRHLLALRLSRAREAFDCFYYGPGLHKYEQLDPALAQFAREHPTAHRIAVRSIVADQKAGAAEHERQMDAYVKAMKRALA
jgi:hypothetical protein